MARGFFIFIFMCGIILIYYPYIFAPSGSFLTQRIENSKAHRSRFYTSKCVVSPPNPWDPSIIEYLLDDSSITTQLTCHDDKVQPELTFLDSSGVLHLNSSAVDESGLEVQCSYRTYDKMYGDDDKLNYTDWITFNESAKINAEFVEVSCQKRWFPRTNVYSNNHNNINPDKSRPLQHLSQSKYSVIIIVLDSVSHSNFRRLMNKTLKTLHSHYDSFVFDGMTKVGDNSFSNAIGFFAGKWWKTEFGDLHGFFDEHDLIWKHYQEEGYRTLYAEDYPGFNLFNYLSKGFKRKPVDHYFRPFWLNVFWSYVHRRSKNLCYGNQKKHNLQLNYLSQFISKYRDEPKFAISWFTELGHDWLNQVRYGDQDLANFLKIHASDLEDSYLVVMSDHGHRFDSIRKTRVGRLEERLPFFSLALPKTLRKNEELAETVNKNTRKLASFFDIYATFRHILTYPARPITTRGQSLLLPLQDRSCKSANIPEDICFCDIEVPLNVTASSLVRTIADDFAEDINKRLEEHVQCVQLELKKVVTASQIGEREEKKFRIVIEMSPSGAIFEALLLYDSLSSKFVVIGDVNRINKYGSQSICVEDQILRKLCFCNTF